MFLSGKQIWEAASDGKGRALLRGFSSNHKITLTMLNVFMSKIIYYVAMQFPEHRLCNCALSL